MRHLAALLLCLPLAASAQTTPPGGAAAGETPAEPPRWSLGAGVGFWSQSFTGSSIVAGPGLYYALGSTSVPAVSASLERALSDRVWLMMGLAGTIDRVRADAYPGFTASSRDLRAASLQLGLRRIVTGAGAPVALSLVGLLDGGVLDVSQEAQATYGASVKSQRVWSAGVSGGIAVDRELTSGLSVRVSTQLAGVSWQRGEIETTAGTLRSSDFSVEVFIAPRLELRLAF